jgi:hypothetical protein
MSGNLQQAIAYIKSGEKQEGKRLLAEMLIQDPSQEVAWLLMAEIVDYDEHRRYCLEQVLKLNPSNKIARDRLEALKQDDKSQDQPRQLTMPSVSSDEAQVESVKPQAVATPIEQPVSETRTLGIGSSRKPEQTQRHRPVLVAVAALTALGGAALFSLTVPAILAFALDPQARLLDAPDILQSLLLMVLGAALAVAGLIGTWWALWPFSGRSPSSRQRRSTGRQQKSHHGDSLDAGLWLDTGNVDEQETGIRLL